MSMADRHTHSSEMIQDDPNVLVIGPNTPTHFHLLGYGRNILDIVDAKNIPYFINDTAVSDLLSEHNPLFITIWELS